MENPFKNKFLLDRKTAYIWQEYTKMVPNSHNSFLKMSETMEENGFHYPENLFSVAIIRFVFKNWFPFISVTLSASRKICHVGGFHNREIILLQLSEWRIRSKIRFHETVKKLSLAGVVASSGKKIKGDGFN